MYARKHCNKHHGYCELNSKKRGFAPRETSFVQYKPLLFDGFVCKAAFKLALIGGSNGNINASTYGVSTVGSGNYLADYLTAIYGNVYCTCHLGFIC